MVSLSADVSGRGNINTEGADRVFGSASDGKTEKKLKKTLDKPVKM